MFLPLWLLLWQREVNEEHLEGLSSLAKFRHDDVSSSGLLRSRPLVEMLAREWKLSCRPLLILFFIVGDTIFPDFTLVWITNTARSVWAVYLPM